jgi:hypothetical protein
MKNEMSEAARKLKNEYSKHHRNMSPEAREMKNEYNRNWKRKNPGKVRKYQIDYWERKVSQSDTIQDQ